MQKSPHETYNEDDGVPAAPESGASRSPARTEEATRLCGIITDAAPLLIAYIDSELCYRFANRAYADWFGIHREQVYGRHVREVIGEVAFERVRPHLEAALRGERVTYETAMPYATGGHRFVHTDIIPDRDSQTGEIRGMVGMIADISDRQRAEQEREEALTALAHSEAEVRYLATHARCLIWHGTVCEVGPPEEMAWDTQVLDDTAAQAFLPLTLQPGERYTNAWYRCRLPEGKAYTIVESRRSLRASESEHHAEFGCENAHGEVRWLSERVYAEPMPRDDQGRRQWRVVGVCLDITERRRAEETLRRQERELAALISHSPDIIARFTSDLRCVFVSPVVERLMGQPVSFFLGKTHAEMGVPAEMYETAEDSLRRIFATGRPDQITFFLPGPNGALRFYEATGVPLFGADGNTVESVMTVSRDVTDRRQAEEERAAAVAERTGLLANMAEAALRQRALLREVLYSVSEGKFRLCDTEAELPEHLTDAAGSGELTRTSLGGFRRLVQETACSRGFLKDRVNDLLTAVGEAGMNAVMHAGSGEGDVSATNDTIQIRITDHGAGIGFDLLHKAMLQRGYSSAGTLGHGFWLMMHTADRVYLLTGSRGTTVVIEQDRTPPEPAWLHDR